MITLINATKKILPETVLLYINNWTVLQLRIYILFSNDDFNDIGLIGQNMIL